MKTVDELFRYGYPAAAAVMFAAFPFNIPLFVHSILLLFTFVAKAIHISILILDKLRVNM